MKMEMPDVLITGGTIVLTGRDALASKRIPKCVRHQASRAKKVFAKVVGNIQHILIVDSRRDKAVAADSRIVMKWNEGEHARLYQNDRRRGSRLMQCVCQMAKRAFVARRRVSHDAW